MYGSWSLGKHHFPPQDGNLNIPIWFQMPGKAGLPVEDVEVSNWRTLLKDTQRKQSFSVTRKPKNVDNKTDKRVTELKELDN